MEEGWRSPKHPEHPGLPHPGQQQQPGAGWEGKMQRASTKGQCSIIIMGG